MKLPKTKIYSRKLQLQYENTLIIGPPKVGKTFLILEFLKNFDKKFLYIDLNDLRERRLDILGYDLVIIENYNRFYPIPNTTTFLTSQKDITVRNFKKIYLNALDFEEYYSFDKHQNITHSFNTFLQDGNFAELIFLDDFFKIQRLQEIFRLMPYDMDILRFLCSHIGEKFSLYQIFQILKKHKKLSKDTFYTQIDLLQKDGIVFFVDKFNALKAPKKVFCYNFGFKNALTYDKNVTGVLENMVFLELKEEVYYLDNATFYLPQSNKIVLVYPFINQQQLQSKLKKLPKNLSDSIEVVTISNEFEMQYKNYEVEVKPFWIWAFVE
ncbi:MAG: ATP-binding protein [Epsilonproteobacteria bacterium]|nr:ATP-binding protein [Campylobacterota bacterium]